MKIAKRVIMALLLLCLVLGLAGCGSENLKDNILNGYEHWLEFNSKHALTKESKLQGKKTKGEDAYVGSYTAEYESFDGEEYIFGGTELERDAGNELTVTYTLNITSGSASIIWIHSGSQYTLTNAECEDMKEITLSSGDNYIMLNGDDFTGSLELEVK